MKIRTETNDNRTLDEPIMAEPRRNARGALRAQWVDGAEFIMDCVSMIKETIISRNIGGQKDKGK